MVFTFNKIKRSLRGALGLLVVLLSFATQATASHYAAADMYVDYIGTGPGVYKYRVRFFTYKFCESASQASLGSESYSVSSPSGCSPFTTSRFLQPRGIDTVDKLCPAEKPNNSCRSFDSTKPAFIRHSFEDTITLPMACTDWTFVWTSGSRNGAIANLQNPSTQNIYIACRINNVAKYNNSSPRFTADPFPYYCANLPAQFLNAPADPDNDSMQTVAIQPRTSATNTIPYAAGFTFANPIAATGTYNVDGQTGTATFTPGALGKYVVSFRVNSYDRVTGTLLGFTERDIQVVILPCSAPPPLIDPKPVDITGGNLISQSPNVVTVCPGSTLKFNIGTKSQNGPLGVVVLTSNNDIATPGSTLTTNYVGTGKDTVGGEYSWTPTTADIGEHTLVFTTTDSTCQPGSPIMLTNNTVVLIKVPNDIEAGVTGFYCPTGNAGYQISVNGPSTNTYVWSVVPGSSPVTTLSCNPCQNPVARPDSTTSYIVEALTKSTVCKSVDTITVVTNNVSILNGEEAVLCKPGYIQLDAIASGPKPVQNLFCGGTVTSACTTPDTVQIGFGTAAGSNPNQTPFYSYYATQRTQYLYRKADLRAAGLRNGTLKRIAFFVTGTPNTAFNNFSIGIKCTQTQAMTVANGFETGTTTVVGPQTITIAPGWNYFDFATPYNWDTTQNILVNICFSNPSSSYNTSPGVQFTTTSYNSAISSNYFSGSVCQPGGTQYGPTVATSLANVRFAECGPDTLDYSYRWASADFLSDSSIKNPIAYVPATREVSIYALGKDGCEATDKIRLLVPVDSFSVSPTDTAICLGESILLTASPASSYMWYENGFNPATTLSCDDCFQPLATPTQNTVYTLVSANSYGISNTQCPDSLYVNLEVKPLPVVNVTPRDTVVKYGRAVNLKATGANLYYWTPTTGLNAAVGSSLQARLEDTAITYTVTGLAENGCRDTARARIAVDYTDNLLVPTAFSPNADGQNDVFRISNFSFQKLQEFRVFNRWGQEIFSTNDGTKGWDGTWKGVEQPTGNYQYLIRVAFPDGLAETYKGNVTLVR